MVNFNFLPSALIGVLAILPNIALSASTADPKTPRLSTGIHRGLDPSELPVLTLPYASYKAATYNKSSDYYVFRNIRFAAPPIGNLRWRPPAAPVVQKGIQDGSYGFQCYQAAPQQLATGQSGVQEPTSEDCLFLDVWVPGKAIRGEVKNLSVLFWIYGGGYTLGSKDFSVYDGSTLLKSAGNNIIYVAANYRLGAFGWLSGPTILGDGVANVGLYDQRAALKWVKDYICLVGGNPHAVTAMGESAGGGSIMLHLLAQGGTLDPLFQQATLQSPGLRPSYDTGKMLQQYQTFEDEAGCAGKGLSCLRAASAETLQAVNNKTVYSSSYGTFTYGPTVDGTLIRGLPGLEIAKGNYWKNIKVVVGHTSNEGAMFTNPSIKTEADFTAAIKTLFPDATQETLDTIQNDLYPTANFATNFLRMSTVIQDFIITCNSRWMTQAYAGKAYAYVYGIPPGIHGTDLLATFWRADINVTALPAGFSLPDKNLATGWQSYFTSFVRSGTPNKYRLYGTIPPTIHWPLAEVTAKGVMALEMNSSGFSWKVDGETNDRCDFWREGSWAGRP